MPAQPRDQRAVRAARRAARASAKGHTRVLPRSFTRRSRELNEAYVQGVFNGQIQEPPIGSLEGKTLARAAAKARWNKADPQYEAAFNKYWYKETPAEESSNANS